jgi:putative endonuclease
MELHYTYILESKKTGKWYIGHCTDLKRRLDEHNYGHTRSTRHKGPWKLIFKKGFETKKESIQFELYLKKLKNKDYIRKKFYDWFLNGN